MRGGSSRVDIVFVLMLAYCAASLLHFAHNAMFLDDYPNMPPWLSPARVAAAWCGVTSAGLAGYWLRRAGHQRTGLATIVLYAALGFAGLDHYARAPLSAHSSMMNVTIGMEALAAAALLIAVCLLRRVPSS